MQSHSNLSIVYSNRRMSSSLCFTLRKCPMARSRTCDAFRFQTRNAPAPMQEPYIYIYIYIYVCVCTLNARCAMSRASISRNGTCRIGCRAVPTVACMITHGCCVVMRTPRCHLWATWSAFCTKRHARSRSARANVPHDAGNCTCDSVRINRGLASCGRLSTQARGQGWLPACASAGRRQQAPH